MNLLLAAALLMQDKTAEETFKSLQESIRVAKTVQVTYRVVIQGSDQGKAMAEFTGDMLLKDGNKVYLSAYMDPAGTLVVVCDGSSVVRMRYPSLTQPVKVKAPEDLRDQASQTVPLRSAPFKYPMDPVWRLFEPGIQEAVPLKFLPTEFEWGVEEANAKTLTYTDKGVDYSLKNKLWLEPKSSRLLKQVETFSLT